MSTPYRSSPAKANSSLFLTISDHEEGDLNNQVDVDLLDIHDRCYARQAVVDNAINRRAREPLKAKCEAAMEEFDKNPAVMVFHQKIMSLLAEVKEHKESAKRMLLES
ncbi:hypothetical protein Tco_1297773 [Tanacetum coccineum]